jgi:hypothetical protein
MYEVRKPGRGGRRAGSGRKPGTKNRPKTPTAHAARELEVAARALFDAAGEGGDEYRLAARVLASVGLYFRARAAADSAGMGRSAPTAIIDVTGTGEEEARAGA